MHHSSRMVMKLAWDRLVSHSASRSGLTFSKAAVSIRINLMVQRLHRIRMETLSHHSNVRFLRIHNLRRLHATYVLQPISTKHSANIYSEISLMKNIRHWVKRMASILFQWLNGLLRPRRGRLSVMSFFWVLFSLWHYS